MLRNLLVISLIAALCVQNLNSWIIQLDYYNNRSAFEKNCVNKARPAMHCHGKCQMLKKIKAEEKKDQESSGKKTTRQLDVISSKSFFCSYAGSNYRYKLAGNGYYFSGLPSSIAADIFHPPCA